MWTISLRQAVSPSLTYLLPCVMLNDFGAQLPPASFSINNSIFIEIQLFLRTGKQEGNLGLYSDHLWVS